MNPVQTLPETYSLAWEVNLKRDWRLNILLQVVGMFWVGLVIMFFWWAFQALRPDLSMSMLYSNDILTSLWGLLLALVVSITLHEMVHGAFFWWFAGSRPKFGLGPGYAYAAMPGWYFPKRQYLLVGLSPLVVLTVLGLFFVPFLPGWLLAPFFWGMVLNAGGAIGDIYVCLRIAREAEDALVKDLGDGMEAYRRM
jgi:hypothetical protein